MAAFACFACGDLLAQPFQLVVQRRLVGEHRRQLLVPLVELRFEPLQLLQRLRRSSGRLREVVLASKTRPAGGCAPRGVGAGEPVGDVEQLPDGA